MKRMKAFCRGRMQEFPFIIEIVQVLPNFTAPDMISKKDSCEEGFTGIYKK
jgi:hypothetical protein